MNCAAIQSQPAREDGEGFYASNLVQMTASYSPIPIARWRALCCPQSRRSGPGSNYRVIGVVPAASNGRREESASHGAKAAALPFSPIVSSNASGEGIGKDASRMAFENIELIARERSAAIELENAEREREQLNEIGMALSSQSDIRVLLNLILAKAREITRADAGSFTC